MRVYEFTDVPDCILRVQLMEANYTVEIGNERILKGEPALGIHAWNERMPKLPKEGANLEWALNLRRQTIHSFRLIASVMQKEPIYSDVRAVCGTSVIFSFTDHTGGKRLIEHLGFTVLPYHSPLGRFGDFWENLFSWWLMWAYNDTSMRSRQFNKLQRTDIWITRNEFLRRYGQSDKLISEV
jgi:YkoP domain